MTKFEYNELKKQRESVIAKWEHNSKYFQEELRKVKRKNRKNKLERIFK